ncbi:MAG: SRPBCC family protein [Pseudomonadota bacterium]
MHIITITAYIDSPPLRVWELVGNFGGLTAWSRAAQGCRLEGEGVGCHRVITLAGGEVRERLEERDGASMRLAYSVISGSTLPVTGMRATLQLTPNAQGGTRVDWTLEGEPQGAPAEVAALLQPRYAARLEELREAASTPRKGLS